MNRHFLVEILTETIPTLCCLQVFNFDISKIASALTSAFVLDYFIDGRNKLRI